MTITLFLACVRRFGITYANRNPLVDQYGNQLLRLSNVLQSVKNSDTKPARTKLPITYVLLAKMFNYFENCIFKCHRSSFTNCMRGSILWVSEMW